MCKCINLKDHEVDALCTTNPCVYSSHLAFSDEVNQQTGRLYVHNNKLCFDGEVDESAEKFLSLINPLIERQVNQFSLFNNSSPVPIKNGKLMSATLASDNYLYGYNSDDDTWSVIGKIDAE